MSLPQQRHFGCAERQALSGISRSCGVLDFSRWYKLKWYILLGGGRRVDFSSCGSGTPYNRLTTVTYREGELLLALRLAAAEIVLRNLQTRGDS